MATKLRIIKIDPIALYNRLIKLIPIIFAAFVSASFVWHFAASKTPFILSFTGAFIYQLVLFNVFDFARKPRHKIIFLIYIVAIFAVTPILSEFYEMIMSSRADELMTQNSAFDWFFGSGSYTRYNPGYCFQLLMYMSLPLGAATYFYTKVYLRISVLFLIALFPPIIYAKDYETYPPYLCVILMALFFITIIYCKFLKNNENEPENNVQEAFRLPVSSSVFLAIAVFAAIIIPKPDIDDRRREFDEFTNGRFSSQFGRITDNFTQTSNGNNTANTSNRVLAQIAASELLNLKTQCYYYYDDSKDVWLPLDQDAELMSADRYFMTMNYGARSENEIEIYDPSALMEEIIYVCNENEEFAEKYNLQSLIGKSDDFGDYKSSLSYISLNENFSPSYFLAPENSFNITISSNATDTTIVKSDSGVLYPMYEANNGLLCYKIGNIVTIDYISPRFIYDNRAQTILRALSYEEYGDFLKELWLITNSKIASDAYLEYYDQNEIYENESERVFSKKIRNLSEEITDGLYSDYEKAKAIEQYFIENGYKYDLEYVCPEGENITDFIFDAKEGSCYHFATAMTLMCRSVGLNARYCEGFSYSEPASQNYLPVNSSAYVIDEGCSHAFCEVYISGYGWMRFDPTVADDGSIIMGSAQIAIAVVIILLISAFLAFIFTKFVYPQLEKIYLYNLSKSEQYEKLCRYIMKSLKKATDSTLCDSAFETAYKAQIISNLDITYIAQCFDSCIYGGNELSYDSANKMIQLLYDFYKARSAKRRDALKQKLMKNFKKRKRIKNKG